MTISRGTKDTSIRSYLSFTDSSVSGALTAAFVKYEFIDKTENDLNFTTQAMIIRHDGGADIEFSRDGINIEGRLTAADVQITLDAFRGKAIYLRGLGADFRMWAW